MTTDTFLTDQLLTELLERRASAAHVDGLLADVVRTARATPQRRRGVVPWPAWPSTMRMSFALAPLVVALAVIGTLVIMPRILSPANPPTPVPTITPAPSPTPGLTLRGGGVDAPTLAAGTYATSLFQPTLTVTLPDQLWAAAFDAERHLLLRAHLPGVSEDENDSVTLVTISNIYENACADGPVRTVPWPSGSDPAALLDWMEAEMSFDFGPRTTRTILGRPAHEVEFVGPDLAHCEGGTLSITDAGPVNPFGSNPAGQTSRYAVFELNGQTVLVGTWTTDPARRDAVWAAADAVLERLALAP